MAPFVCKSCAAPNDQAAVCAACGGHTFELSAESRIAADKVLRPRYEPNGKLVPISEAPSFRRRRGWRAAG